MAEEPKTITDAEVEKARKRLINEVGMSEKEANEAIRSRLMSDIEDQAQQTAARKLNLSATQRALLGIPDGYGEEGLNYAQKLAMFAGPALGGIVGGGLGQRAAASPGIARAIEGAPKYLRLAGEQLMKYAPLLGEFAGVAGGDVVGREIAGVPQNIPESVAMGSLGAGVGGTYRGATRLASGLGEVPSMATREAAIPAYGVLPSRSAIVRPAPITVGQARAGISAESRLQARAAAALQRLEAKSPMRIQKENIIANAEADGVRIEPTKLIEAFEAAKKEIAVTSGGAKLNAKIDQEITRLVGKATERGGSFTPTEWDKVLQEYAEEAYKLSGEKKTSPLSKAYRNVRRAGAEEFRVRLPEGVRKLDAEISGFMENLQEAKHYFGGDRAGIVNRLRNIKRPGKEDELRALEWISGQKGAKDPKLHSDAMRVGVGRDYTVDLRGVAESANIGKGGSPIKALFEAAGQYMAPFQHHVGPLTAAGVRAGSPETISSLAGQIPERLSQGRNLVEAGVPVAQQVIRQILDAVAGMAGGGTPDERDIHLRGNIP